MNNNAQKHFNPSHCGAKELIICQPLINVNVCLVPYGQER